MKAFRLAVLLFAPVIVGAQTITGSWRIVGDTNAMPGLTLKLVELGQDITEGIIVRGTWTALRVGCEPASNVSCYVQGDAIGIRKGTHMDLDLVPVPAYGMGGNLSVDVVSTTGMQGGVGVRFSRDKLFVTEKVAFTRTRQ